MIIKVQLLEPEEIHEFETEAEVDLQLLARAFGLGKRRVKETDVGQDGTEIRRYTNGYLITVPE